MDGKRQVRIALVEDHEGTRVALRDTLRGYPTRIEVVAAFADGESLLRSSLRRLLDVAVVDLGLPGLSGGETIRALSAELPAVHCVALTVFEDEESVLDVMRAGAYGYLLKDEPDERLISAIEEAAVGSHPLSSRIAGFLIAEARRSPPKIVLTDREEQVARALAEGASYLECADRLGIALGTVQDHVKRIYRKLDVGSKKEVRLWLERRAG